MTTLFQMIPAPALWVAVAVHGEMISQMPKGTAAQASRNSRSGAAARPRARTATAMPTMRLFRVRFGSVPEKCTTHGEMAA